MALDEENKYANARISVWWDMNNCGIPEGCDPKSIASNIKTALRDQNYLGDVSFYAYGDLKEMPLDVQECLRDSEIILRQAPNANGADQYIQMEAAMLTWTWTWTGSRDKFVPCNFLLISDADDFICTVEVLRCLNKNVLVAHPQPDSPLPEFRPLIKLASTVWRLDSLFAGLPPLYVKSLTTPDSKPISVWWDMKNCPVPEECDPKSIRSNIINALRDQNYLGSVSIYAYDNLTEMSSLHKSLSHSGILVCPAPQCHICKMEERMLAWFGIRGPCNCLLISNADAFSYPLNALRGLGMNVLLAHPEPPLLKSSPLVTVATTVWQCDHLLTGAGVPPVVVQPSDGSLGLQLSPVTRYPKHGKRAAIEREKRGREEYNEHDGGEFPPAERLYDCVCEREQSESH